jgi:hypothetical protein
LDPGLVAQGAEPSGLGDKAVPGLAAGVDDGPVIREHAQRREALAQVQPDALDRVEKLWGGRRGWGILGAGNNRPMEEPPCLGATT